MSLCESNFCKVVHDSYLKFKDEMLRNFDHYVAHRCLCTYHDGTSCSTRYSAQEMVKRRLDMASMEPSEYMLVLQYE